MHLKEFRARKLTDITRNDIVVLHAEIGRSAPYRANRVVALLRKMFNLAKDWGLMSGDNPATRIQFFKEVSRDRFLRPGRAPASIRGHCRGIRHPCPRRLSHGAL